LTQWVLTNHPVLIEAARRIANHVLKNHIRTTHYPQGDEFPSKMVSDIITQLQVSSERRNTPIEIKPSVPTANSKKPRGRPRKQKLAPPLPIENNQRTGPQTRNKSSAQPDTFGLLAAPAFTTSPIKSIEKKVRLILSHIFYNCSDQRREKWPQRCLFLQPRKRKEKKLFQSF